ncbi:MAG: phosphatidic acid phosphatase [Ruminococcaceae bacterium]|nr:phosphatidic acid phosphatase [Oscillospiraceae bacterium]
MKRPVVNYKEFSLSKINEPQFSHLKYLWGWIGYFILFFLTERFIPAEKCSPIHCALDDMIPFCEYFAIAYVFWYVLIVVSLLYFALYDPSFFKQLMTYIIVTQVVAITIYVLFPSRQDLRPEVFPRDNILTRLMGFIYSVDTNTGVCPSLHVSYSLGIASTWLKYKDSSKLWKCFVVVAVVLICMSVAFVKQHSVLDIAAAVPVCLLAEIIAFGKSYWTHRLRQ